MGAKLEFFQNTKSRGLFCQHFPGNPFTLWVNFTGGPSIIPNRIPSHVNLDCNALTRLATTNASYTCLASYVPRPPAFQPLLTSKLHPVASLTSIYQRRRMSCSWVHRVSLWPGVDYLWQTVFSHLWFIWWAQPAPSKTEVRLIINCYSLTRPRKRIERWVGLVDLRSGGTCSIYRMLKSYFAVLKSLIRGASRNLFQERNVSIVILVSYIDLLVRKIPPLRFNPKWGPFKIFPYAKEARYSTASFRC